jgi:hypothetical protein
VRRETKRLEQKRISLGRQLEMERVNLISLEHRQGQISAQTRIDTDTRRDSVARNLDTFNFGFVFSSLINLVS